MARRWLALLLALALAIAAPALARGAPPAVLVLDLVGPINPVTARYVAHGLAEAEQTGAPAVVLRLDTPGGLDAAMRDIVRMLLGARVPVIVWVAPPGARAASAGMFVALAAHVAAMAPDTVIGAAHPVGGGGEEIKGPMADKVTNDAAALARSLATTRGRDARWAEDAVRKSLSLTATEAKRRGVVDRVAADLPALLAAVDGMKVALPGGPRTLRTAGAPTTERPLSRLEQLLLVLSNPVLALLLLNVGVLGVVFELQNPGAVLPGVVGVICLLLGCYALGLVPVNGVGLGLMGFGLALLVAELYVASGGVLAVGGVAALVLGSLMLFQPGAEGMAPPVAQIVAIAAGTGALALGAVWLGLRAQRRRVRAGAEDLVGRLATVREPLAPAGVVFVEGELWRARTDDPTPIPAGDRVEVAAVDGLTLWVRGISRPG